LRLAVAKVTARKASLLEVGLLDDLGDKVSPHNWKCRQFKSDHPTERVREFRERGVSETLQEVFRNGTETPSAPARASVSVSESASENHTKVSGRFAEFWNQYPLKKRMDATGRMWVQYVTKENEGLVFACLGRYLNSREVESGAVTNPDKWIYERSEDKWASEWPLSTRARITTQADHSGEYPPMDDSWKH
jgi:hypothetical protein